MAINNVVILYFIYNYIKHKKQGVCNRIHVRNNDPLLLLPTP